MRTCWLVQIVRIWLVEGWVLDQYSVISGKKVETFVVMITTKKKYDVVLFAQGRSLTSQRTF